MSTERVAIGYVARAHGVRGELRVHTHDPGSSSLYDVERAWFGDRELVIDSVRPTQGALLVKLDGVDDRDAAEALAGKPVEIVRKAIELAPGEFLVADVPGCEVVDTGGRSLGKVVSVLHGPQDILVIHDATHERMLPLVPQLVVEADMAARKLIVDPPDELPAEPISGPPPKPRR
jgi:16S rRNA processing protein RimM